MFGSISLATLSSVHESETAALLPRIPQHVGNLWFHGLHFLSFLCKCVECSALRIYACIHVCVHLHASPNMHITVEKYGSESGRTTST